MDLILNFGEHYFEAGNSSLFYDILITFTGAFLGFFFALLINRKLEKKQIIKDKELEKKESFSNLKYLSLLLDSVLKSYPKQAKNYKGLSIILKETPLELSQPIINATYDLTRLKNIDSKELRDAYIAYFPKELAEIEKYKKIFSHIDFLLMYFADLINQNENHRIFQHKDQQFVRDCFEEVAIRLGLRQKNIQLENPNNYIESQEFQYIHKFNLIFKEIADESPINFTKIQDNYFLPLNSTVLQGIADIELSDTIFLLVKKSISRLKHIEFNSIEFAKDLENVENRIKESIEYLTKINEKIKDINEP